ncbi:MAG: hypothetical protein M0Z53_04020 [Thermaerobacter sp.]|nr:hypothetical protein [Thermaerobacter sp.]
MQRVAGGMTLGLIALSLTVGHARPAPFSSPTPTSRRAAPLKPAVVAQPALLSKPALPVRDGRVFWLQAAPGARVSSPASVTDTPWGILYLVPPGWTPGSTKWHLDLAPVPGATRIVGDNGRLAAWSGRQLGGMTIAGVTGNFALIVANPVPGASQPDQLYAVDLYSGRTHRLWHWNPSLGNAPFIYGQSRVAWWIAGTGRAETVNLASGHSATFAGIPSAAALPILAADWGGSTAKLTTPPPGWQWVFLNNQPVMAVPGSWNIRQFSSQAALAVNPQNPQESARYQVWPAAALTAVPGGKIAGPFTPGALLPSGASARWLNDHSLLYTLSHRDSVQSGFINVTASGQGEVVTVTAPLAANATGIAQDIVRQASRNSTATSSGVP